MPPCLIDLLPRPTGTMHASTHHNFFQTPTRRSPHSNGQAHRVVEVSITMHVTDQFGSIIYLGRGAAACLVFFFNMNGDERVNRCLSIPGAAGDPSAGQKSHLGAEEEEDPHHNFRFVRGYERILGRPGDLLTGTYVDSGQLKRILRFQDLMPRALWAP